jgi:hypothetical protein
MKKVKKNNTNKPKDINLPKEDIKVEKGQLTFLPALRKIIKKKK